MFEEKSSRKKCSTKKVRGKNVRALVNLREMFGENFENFFFRIEKGENMKIFCERFFFSINVQKVRRNEFCNVLRQINYKSMLKFNLKKANL